MYIGDYNPRPTRQRARVKHPRVLRGRRLQLHGYDDAQLGGFGKKMFKSIAKAVSAPIKATQTILKDPKKFIKDPKLMTQTVFKASVAAPLATIKEPLKLIRESEGARKAVKGIAHAGAAYLTGGASLALTASMLAQEKAKKAQAEQQAQVDEQNRLLEAEMAVALPASPVEPIVSTAPSADAVSATIPRVTATAQRFLPAVMPTNMQTEHSTAVQPAKEPRKRTAGSKLPTWAIPAGVGLAVVALLPLLMRGRR